MKRLLLFAALLTFHVVGAYGQGVPLPYVQQQFFAADGSALANGFVCTIEAGAAGVTPLEPTYSDANQTIVNQNPVRLNAAGRPTNSGQEITIFLSPESYKINVYASGSGNTCGNTTVGDLISSRDNVTAYNFLTTGNLDITGDITVTGQLISTKATGTAPIVVTSTTPVANLTAHPEAYNAAGTQQTNVHHVFGSVALSGGTATVTLTGSAQFTSNTTYVCQANDSTAIQPVRVTRTSGTSITFTGTTTDLILYHCSGN